MDFKGPGPFLIELSSVLYKLMRNGLKVEHPATLHLRVSHQEPQPAGCIAGVAANLL